MIIVSLHAQIAIFFFQGQVVADLSFCFGSSVESLSNIYRNSGYLFFKEVELNKILFHINNSTKHKHNFFSNGICRNIYLNDIINDYAYFIYLSTL